MRHGGGGGATVRLFLTEEPTIIILAILASVASIGLLCWLLFSLAVFALPAFVGVTAGAWAHGTGAGIPGVVLVGVAAAALTLAAGHLLITSVRPIWLKLIVAIAFVAPAAIAGFHATHGIVKHLMPSEGWQITFSVVGSIAVGVTAFVRVAGMAGAPGPSGRHLAQAWPSASPLRRRDQQWTETAHVVGSRSERCVKADQP